VGDRPSERAFLVRALDVDVNPLVIAGRFREQIDALLRDVEPVAVAEVFTDDRF